MTKLFMLSYDTDEGNREDWSVFYTPVEAFSTIALRDARKLVLSKAVDSDGINHFYEFHEYEITLDQP